MTAPSAWAPDLPSTDDWKRWGIDPSWSRLIDVPNHDGGTHRWHVLDTGAAPDAPDDPQATLLCVHGNPTWAYLWATFLRRLGHTNRVIAIDQLGMGYSERCGQRRYTDRVRDLEDVIGCLDIDSSRPSMFAAHDWGGAIAMGWAVDHVDQFDGLILCNTGIAVPDGRSAPRIIRLAASAPLLDFVCRGTRIFVEGTARLSGKRISALDREAFGAPYATSPSRAAIADFVDDIPLRPGHPSEQALADVAERLGDISAPVLLAWGSKDPVFDDDFAADLAGRIPTTTLHRFPRAGHLVMAEADVAAVAEAWLTDVVAGRMVQTASAGGSKGQGENDADVNGAPKSSMWAGLDTRRGDDATAFVDLATGDSVTFAELLERIDAAAAGLVRRGLQRGDRVAMLTPPGVDLVVTVYGVWRAGGVTVIADRGLGLAGLGAAVRSTRPTWVIGPKKALAAARTMKWATNATRLNISQVVGAERGNLPDLPAADDQAAVLFTSGATGPAKGVMYRHRQLTAQRDALAASYDITSADRLVAAFAPFALYGPALGIPTALPDCDVTKPGELTADLLDAACRRVGATMAFASPAALANVARTARQDGSYSGLSALRLVLSAGAPVPGETLHAVAEFAPAAALHTPYGMTEALPVADIELVGIDLADADDPVGGVCVGAPVTGAEVRIVALDFSADTLPDAIPDGEMGEILVSAPWVSDGYLGLWAIQRAARPVAAAADGGHGRTVWHRSGDVGHFDEKGRLWVEGRSVHVVHTVDGPVTPVPVERVVERGLDTTRVAAVGVGPRGSQQLVVVVEDAGTSVGLADFDLSARVRELVDAPVAAVLSLHRIPVDIRHNAKIDRAAVARWADDLLAGRRARPPK